MHFDREVDPPSLHVDAEHEDEHGGHEVGEVGQVLAIERFADGVDRPRVLAVLAVLESGAGAAAAAEVAAAADEAIKKLL